MKNKTKQNKTKNHNLVHELSVEFEIWFFNSPPSFFCTIYAHFAEFFTISCTMEVIGLNYLYQRFKKKRKKKRKEKEIQQSLVTFQEL